jgi:hypothetical protein
MHQRTVALKQVNIPIQKMIVEQSMGWKRQVVNVKKSLHKDWTHLGRSQIRSSYINDNKNMMNKNS